MKAKSNEYNGSILMLYQLIIITICLSPFFFTLDNTGFVNQLPGNLILALLTTAIGHTYFLYSFKNGRPREFLCIDGFSNERLIECIKNLERLEKENIKTNNLLNIKNPKKSKMKFY